MCEPRREDHSELPSHTDRVDDAGAHDDTPLAGMVVVAVLGALVMLIVVLHFIGVVGPGAH